MGKFVAIFACLVLAGCAQHGEQQGTAYKQLACPKLPKFAGYSVSSTSGIDSFACKLSPTRATELPVTLYVGNYPPPQPNLQFHAFSPSPIGSLAWFVSRPAPTSRDVTWVTYIPTNSSFPAVIQVVVHSRGVPTQAQLSHIASLVLGGSIAP